MIFLTQTNGSKLILNESPQKIISLVPSITENLILFGKTPAARTSFCIEPADKVKNIPVIGGTKTPRVSKIISMKPDLVIANQEENIKAHIEEIQSHQIPVWVTFPKKLEDLTSLMRELGSVCESSAVADSHVERFEKLLKWQKPHQRHARTITLIWKNPWMAVGQDTYTSDLLKFCGFENPVSGRYPVMTVDEIQMLNPDLIILPTEPYKFVQHDVDEWRRISESVLFNGEDLLWSGPRVFKAVEALNELYKRLENR